MELTPREEISLWARINRHLQYNHYPPKPRFVAPCIEAIRAIVDGNPKKEINLNNALGYTGEGYCFQIAEKLLEDFHLLDYAYELAGVDEYYYE